MLSPDAEYVRLISDIQTNSISSQTADTERFENETLLE